MVKEKSGKRFARLRKRSDKPLASSSSSDNQDVSLDQGLEIAREAIDMFLNNKFDESRDIIQPL